MANLRDLQPNIHTQTLRSALIGSVEGMMRDQLFPVGVGSTAGREVGSYVMIIASGEAFADIRTS